MTTNTDLVRRYFDRADSGDVHAYLQLFAPTAVVEDDGHRYSGLQSIRSWRGGTVPVRSQVLDVLNEDGGSARVRISGQFPGSPVVLVFRFASTPTAGSCR